MNIFFVGMQVICVDDCGLPKTSNLPNKPVRGRVYKIRYVGINPIGEIGVTLHELVNPKSRSKWGRISEPGFFAWRFRPATDSRRASSMSMPPQTRYGWSKASPSGAPVRVDSTPRAANVLVMGDKKSAVRAAAI